MPVLYRMERAGVLVDRELLKAQSSELAARMLELQAQAHAEAGGVFNVDSPKQLQEILFGKLGIPVMRKTPTGQPSTAEDVLEELAATYPLPKLILEYRGMAKLKSTYTDKLPRADQCRQRDASIPPITRRSPPPADCPRRIRICKIFRSAPRRDGASGRPSSRRRATRWSPPTIRKSSCASWRICRAMRACCAPSPKIATSIRRPPPKSSARRWRQVSADQRRSAKAINFGLMYGMSAFGLARQLGIGRGEAQKYMDLYFERYPGVKRYMEETRRQARETGFVETVFGRRLYLPEIQSRNACIAPICRTQRHQRAHAGHGRRHHQARHDRGGLLGCKARACRRGSSCRCTTNWFWRSRTRRSRRVVGQLRTHMARPRNLRSR